MFDGLLCLFWGGDYHIFSLLSLLVFEYSCCSLAFILRVLLWRFGCVSLVVKWVIYMFLQMNTLYLLTFSY